MKNTNRNRNPIPATPAVSRRSELQGKGNYDINVTHGGPKLIYQTPDGELAGHPDPRGEEAYLASAARCLDRGNDGGSGARAAAEKLHEFAAENGLVLDPEAFQSTVLSRKELASGSEHSVYFDKASGRVIKITHPDMVGSGAVGQSKDSLQYLRNLLLHNIVFADDIRLEGVVRLDGELPQVGISQPFVKGAKATPEEIADFFARKGFKSDRSGGWVRGDIRISDAVPDNVMKAGKEIILFDVQIEVNRSTESLANDASKL